MKCHVGYVGSRGCHETVAGGWPGMSAGEAICAVWTELGLRPPQVVAARGGAQGSVPLEWLRDLTRRHRLAPAAACSDGPTFDVYISVSDLIA